MRSSIRKGFTMNVLLVGTGNVFSTRLSPCFVFDQSVVMELPNGAVKRIKSHRIEIDHLELCLFSHIHADHCFDFPFLLLEKLQNPNSCKLVVGGPTGITNHLKSLCHVAYATLNWENIFAQTVAQIIEYPDSADTYQHGEYQILIQSVKHNDTPCSGFLISTPDSKKFAYTGDSSLCYGVDRLLWEADICCTDMNSTRASSGHMSLEDLKTLAVQYPHKIYAVHTEDLPFLRSWHEGIYFPDDGTSLSLTSDVVLPLN